MTTPCIVFLSSSINVVAMATGRCQHLPQPHGGPFRLYESLSGGEGGGRQGGGGKFALVMYGCSRLVNQPQFVRGPDCDCSRCCGTPCLSFQHIPQVWWLWQSGAASICCSHHGRTLHSVWVIVRRRYLVEEALLPGGEDEGESGDLGRERRRGTGGGLEGGDMTHGDGV